MWWLWLWRWSGGEEGTVSGYTILLCLGFLGLLLGAFFLQQGTDRSQWPTATARVLSVQVRCEMTATEAYRTRYSRRSQTVAIPCDQTDRFRADNPGRDWKLRERRSGQVSVVGSGEPVIVTMGLGNRSVGDTFEVLQNPDNPAEFSFAQLNLSAQFFGGCVAGLGAFLLAIAFFWS